MGDVSKPWTIDDYDYLYKHYNEDGLIACANHLKRSPDHVQLKVEKLGLCSLGEFTQEERRYARAYGKILKGAMIFLMPGRTSYEVEELIKCARKQ